MSSIIQEWQTISLFEVSHIAKWVLENLKNNRIFLLSGAVGSGKTTFVREYLKNCGVGDFEGSPTFNYYNIYPLSNIAKDLVLLHIDMYRIHANDHDFQIEFEDLQLLNSILFIENYNPQKGRLLDKYLVIYFKDIDEGERRKIWIEG